MERRSKVPALLVPVFVLALWKGEVALFRLPVHVLPPPETVFARLWGLILSSTIQKNLGATALEIAVGFSFGLVFGVVAGFVLARSETLEKVLSPFILVFQTAPKISLAPLFVLWFGLGMASKAVLIALVAFFPIMLNVMVGVRSVNPDYLRMLRILGATRSQRLLKVELPSALPALLTGVRAGLVLSVTAAIIAEMMGARYGLGFLLMTGNEMYDIPLVLAAIFVISLLCWALDAGMRLLQDALLFWHESAAQR
jgi:NitT/TauT family transport system permease protein